MIRCAAVLAFLCAACSFAGDAYVWNSWDPTGTNVNLYPYNWSRTKTFTTQGGWYHRMSTNITSETLTLPLGKTNSAGTWYLWHHVYFRDYGSTTNGVISYSAGGGSVDFQCTSLTWQRTNFTTSTAFTNLNVTVQRNTLNPNSEFDWILSAFYLTTNANESIAYSSIYNGADSLFRDYSIPTSSNITAVAGNLLPNSSFELGLFGSGWMHARLANTVSNQYAQRLIDAETLTGGYDGDSFASISDGPKVRSYLYSPVIRLRGGREKRQYTISYWAKGSGTLTATFSPVLQPIAGVPTNTFMFSSVVNANWTRYSTSIWFSPSPTREMTLDLSTGGNISVDCVQVEEGALTDWTPRKPVEFTLYTGKQGNVFGFSETQTIYARCYNLSGSEASRVLTVAGTDANNRQVYYGTHNLTLPVGLSTNLLPIALTNRGSTMLTARMSDDPLYADEMAVSIVALPSSTALETNSVIGTHGMFDGPLALTNVAQGFSWSRSLSPGRIFRWSLIEPSSNTFTWIEPDYKVSSLSNNAIVLGNLATSDSEPAWGVNGDFIHLDSFSNYVYQVVNRYKDSIRYWEGWNEANQHFTESEQTQMEEVQALAVKTADPTAYFIAFGGATDHTRMSNIWNGLTASARAAIDAFSVHFYPSDIANESFNDTRFAPVMVFANAAGRPVWNTESGAYSLGLFKGDKVGWTSDATWVWPTMAEEVFQRGEYPADLTLHAAIRSLGYGMQKYFYYDSRVASYRFRDLDTNPTLNDYDDGRRPVFAGLLWAKYLIDPPTSALKLTHPSAATVEGYLFGKDGNSILFVWSYDKTNRIATITNTTIGQFDQWGNLLATNSATLAINRHPWAWFSSVLTTNQMAATFTNASIAGSADVTAPNISIDSTPVGTIAASDVPLRFKWTAIDDTYRQSAYYPSNVLTRYKLTGRDSDWSGWSDVRSVAVASVVPGTYSLAVQAKDSEGQATNQIDGPAFNLGGASATANSATVGTLTSP